MSSRVVVTGLGCFTSLGTTVGETWKAILKGTSGLQLLQTFPEFNEKFKGLERLLKPSLRIGKVRFDGIQYDLFSGQELRRTALFSQVAMVTANEALCDAQLLESSRQGLIKQVDPDRIGCIIGTGIPSIHDIYDAVKAVVDNRQISSFFIPRSLNNMASGNVSIKFNLRGINHSPSMACATGNNAIGDAYNFIKLGYADAILAGASEMSVHPLVLAGFLKAKSISISGVPRPFDSERDGFALGEGCGLMVLESLEHAVKRGANIVAEVVGYGLSSDAYHITSPPKDGDGAKRSMKMALQHALKWEDRHRVGYVNAHATGTLLGDRAEIQGINEIFGKSVDSPTYVSSNKGHLGHLLSASGAVEAVLTVKSLCDGIIPHTLNLKSVVDANTDETCRLNGLNFVKHRPVKFQSEFALNNSFGFGGINSSVLFKRVAI